MSADQRKTIPPPCKGYLTQDWLSLAQFTAGGGGGAGGQEMTETNSSHRWRRFGPGSLSFCHCLDHDFVPTAGTDYFLFQERMNQLLCRKGTRRWFQAVAALGSLLSQEDWHFTTRWRRRWPHLGGEARAPGCGLRESQGALGTMQFIMEQGDAELAGGQKGCFFPLK